MRSVTRLVAVAVAAVAAVASAQDKLELNTITKVQVSGGTITIVGSKKPNFTTFTMTDPARLVIDISEAVFSGVADEQQVGNGVVTAIKTASYGSDASAIARVLIGFEKEFETDIQSADTKLVVKVLGAPGGGEAVAQAPAQPAEDTGKAEADQKAAEQAAAAQAAKEKAEADRQAAAQAAADKAAADKAAKEQAAAERKAAEEQKKQEALAAKQAAEEEKKRKAEEAAAEREAKKQEALAAKQAAEEERKRKAEEAAAERESKQQETLTAKQAAEEEKKRKAEEAAAEREAKRQEALAAKQAAAEEKKRLAEEAAAEREAKRQEALAAKEQQRVAMAETRSSGGGEVESSSSLSVSSRRKTMTFVGFKQESGAQRVYVRTNEPVRYTLQREGDKQVVLELENTAIALTNNTRFMDTSYFNGAVAMVDPQAGPTRTVRIEIKLKENVPYEAKQEGNEVYVDFQTGGR